MFGHGIHPDIVVLDLRIGLGTPIASVVGQSYEYLQRFSPYLSSVGLSVINALYNQLSNKAKIVYLRIPGLAASTAAQQCFSDFDSSAP